MNDQRIEKLFGEMERRLDQMDSRNAALIDYAVKKAVREYEAANHLADDEREFVRSAAKRQKNRDALREKAMSHVVGMSAWAIAAGVVWILWDALKLAIAGRGQ